MLMPFVGLSLKSVGFIGRQPDCRTAYLQFGTIKELSMTGGPATEKG